MRQREAHKLLKDAMALYASLSSSSWELFKEVTSVKSVKKGEHILRIGQVAKYLHFICSGAFRSYYLDLEGNIYNKNIFLENDFPASTVSLLTGEPSNFGLEALEDSIIIHINFLEYKNLIHQNDDLKNFYIAYIETNWIIKKEAKEISLVMKDATSRYLALMDKHPNLDKRIPQFHIAAHLGITPTQLSRIRRSLKKANQHM